MGATSCSTGGGTPGAAWVLILLSESSWPTKTMRTRQPQTACFMAFPAREGRTMPAGLCDMFGLCDMLAFFGYLADQWTVPGGLRVPAASLPKYRTAIQTENTHANLPLPASPSEVPLLEAAITIRA
jgi:hypothetical protein